MEFIERPNRFIAYCKVDNNMDSQAPNKVVYGGLMNKSIILPNLDEDIILIKTEKTYCNSRFDIYL
ncbi:MAG: hypothetical protein RR942_07330 [Romboutsia sp.]